MASTRSTLLSHPQRAELEQAIADGVLSTSEIARRFDVSRAAVQRYAHRRLILSMANPLEASEDGDPTSLVERLSMLADDLRAARQRLLQQGHLSSHTSAARAEAHVVLQLMEVLEVDHADLDNYGREGRALSKVLMKIIDANARNGLWISDRLRELDEPALAAAVEDRANRRLSASAQSTTEQENAA